MKVPLVVFLMFLGMMLGCGKKHVPVEKVENEWIELKGKWEWVSGGDIDEAEELNIGWGESLTAVRWGGDVPKVPFEVEMEAMRVDGTDFFGALTFPVRDGKESVTLVLGGWGGGLVGISSVNDLDASENETTMTRRFQKGVWYAIRLICEQERIRVWIDGEQVVDLNTEGKKLGLRPGPIVDCAPFGLGTWQTTGKVRQVRWRPVLSEK